MPQPSNSLATLRPDLGGSMEEFNLEADRAGFISLEALPVFDVAEQSDTFGVIPVEQLLREANTERAPKGGYSRDDYEFEDASYATKEHGHEAPVDDKLRRMYRHYFDAEQVATRRARDKVLRNMERRAAGLLFNTGTFANAGAGSSWVKANWGTCKPIDDIETAVQALWNSCGMWANGIIIPRLTFRNLRQCAQVIERLNGHGIRDIVPEKITAEMLALVFDIPKVMIAGGTRNTANEGQAGVFGSIWNKDRVMVGVFAQTNDIEEPCIGRTFHWSEDGSEIGCTIETYRDEKVRGDVVRARHEVDQKIIQPACGRLVTGVNP